MSLDYENDSAGLEQLMQHADRIVEEGGTGQYRLERGNGTLKFSLGHAPAGGLARRPGNAMVAAGVRYEVRPQIGGQGRDVLGQR